MKCECPDGPWRPDAGVLSGAPPKGPGGAALAAAGARCLRKGSLQNKLFLMKARNLFGFLSVSENRYNVGHFVKAKWSSENP